MAAIRAMSRNFEPYFMIEDDDDWRRVNLVESEFPYTIGRARDCTLVMDHQDVSRLHARLDLDHQQVTIVDLGSTNGTFVNKERLKPDALHRLRAGDCVQLGTSCAMEFEDPATTSTIPTVAVAMTGLRMDDQSARVSVDGYYLDPPLSPGQFALLKLLYEHESSVVTRDQVRDYVWGPGQRVSEQTLDAMVSRLRRRLHQVDSSHEYIITRRGFGLMFRNKP